MLNDDVMNKAVFVLINQYLFTLDNGYLLNAFSTALQLLVPKHFLFEDC